MFSLEEKLKKHIDDQPRRSFLAAHMHQAMDKGLKPPDQFVFDQRNQAGLRSSLNRFFVEKTWD